MLLLANKFSFNKLPLVFEPFTIFNIGFTGEIEEPFKEVATIETSFFHSCFHLYSTKY